MSSVWWIAIFAVAGLTLAVLFRRFRRKSASTTPLGRAKQQFHVQRERLEAKFVQLAAAQVHPEAPKLADCMFDDDVSYVRSRTTGQLSAFVAVTMATEGIAAVFPTGMSVVENLQAGTAVFRFDRDHWETDGRAILNLSPDEAAERFGGDLELVEQEFAHRV
jgi:hypothetical protein